MGRESGWSWQELWRGYEHDQSLLHRVLKELINWFLIEYIRTRDSSCFKCSRPWLNPPYFKEKNCRHNSKEVCTFYAQLVSGCPLPVDKIGADLALRDHPASSDLTRL